MSLKFGDYYIADVSFKANNPIHRVIATVINDDIPMFELYSTGYEHPIAVNPDKDLYYFKLINKIRGMESSYELPEEKLVEY